MAKSAVEVRLIETHRTDPYKEKVVDTYDDPPEVWHKALGENLSFQFGLFDHAELAEGPKPGPVGPSEFRHFDRQLELAGLLAPARPQIHRILDLGCGWGFITQYLAALFPECQCVDAINISQRQLSYCADNLPESLKGRVNLYLCNGQDVDLLPDPAVSYDLVVVRGVYTHFLPNVFEASVARVAQRLSYGGTLLISDTLYKNADRYKPPLPDMADRLACGNRKSPDYFVSALRQNGLIIQDMRVLPSNAEIIHWFHKVQLNIEQNFPDSVTGPIQELHEMALSFTQSLAKNEASVYSIIAIRQSSLDAPLQKNRTTGNAFSVSPGTVFNLPKVVTRLSAGCQPDCPQLDQASDAWARPYLIGYFGDEERADRYLRQRISHFACICYPQAPAEHAQALTNLMIPVTLYDDTFSKPGIQESITAANALHSRWCTVFDGHRPPPHDNSAFLLVHHAIEAAAAQMPRNLARRARQAWRDMADSHLDEAVVRNNDLTLSFDQYMDKRLTNVYGWWLTLHVEYAVGIDLGDLSDHPDILAARRAAIHHVTLVNDLYSFPKELDAKEAMNAILVLLRDGLGLQHSVDKVVDLIHQAENDFHSARDHILRSQLGRRSDIRVYLDGIGYVMTGNLSWSQMSTRYFGDQHDSSPITSGPLTLTPKPTVHTAAPRVGG